MVSPAQSTPQATIPGRTCGSCTQCCRVYEIPALQKPMGVWCQHCTPGRGCNAYDARPEQCQQFYCLWMQATFLGPEWKPDKARFVLTVDAASQFLYVQLDANQPAAWRKQPYYGQLKQWAAAGLQNGRLVIIFLNQAATLVLPDKDVELGVPKPGETILLEQRPRVGGGFEYSARFGVPGQ